MAENPVLVHKHNFHASKRSYCTLLDAGITSLNSPENYTFDYDSHKSLLLVKTASFEDVMNELFLQAIDDEEKDGVGDAALCWIPSCLPFFLLLQRKAVLFLKFLKVRIHFFF